MEEALAGEGLWVCIILVLSLEYIEAGQLTFRIKLIDVKVTICIRHQDEQILIVRKEFSSDDFHP